MYESLGIDPGQKTVIYSDSLSVDKAILLQKQANELGFKQGICFPPFLHDCLSTFFVASYGIGTFFTNDFRTASSGGAEKSKALNIVIKLSSIGNEPCIKISDDMTKVRDNVYQSNVRSDRLLV